MEPRWWRRSLAAGCLVLLLGCWGPEEAVAAVSVGHPPCSPQTLPGGAEPRGWSSSPFNSGVAALGLRGRPGRGP